MSGVVTAEGVLTLECSTKDFGNAALTSKAIVAASTATEVKKSFFFMFIPLLKILYHSFNSDLAPYFTCFGGSNLLDLGTPDAEYGYYELLLEYLEAHSKSRLKKFSINSS
ncbi:hypothetical protein [Nitrosospira multiformis]|uniref:hypothetical protein n=1 Tax=Nitrosospira multiformis TaxID=1231 RepID=UPI000D319EEA|nr:hypothetical protein [Nitrosospira multiformis]